MGLNDAGRQAWTTVQTDAGPISVVPVDSLRARIEQLNDWLVPTAANAATLHAQADDRFASAGAVLLPRASEWTTPESIGAEMARASALVAQIADNDTTTAGLRDEESHGNVIGRIGAWRHARALSSERASEAAELRTLLIVIAKAAPPASIPEAEVQIHEGTDLEEQATKLDEGIAAAKQSVVEFNTELERRQESTKTMGFDALYEAATLATSGAVAVDSPLLLKPGEVAYLSEVATLARMIAHTHYVGGASGFSFPIGHTGIRYRVGSYSGRPVQQQSLSNLDSGSFVVTNQRIAFIGHTKSTSIPLGKILHVECYTDAVAVFQEGRESPDFYMLGTPKRAVFYLNWALNQQGKVKA